MAKNKIIHINQHIIKKNTKEGTSEPCITVKTYNSHDYAQTVKILGPSEVIYSSHKPLSCGARCWIQTKAPIRLMANGQTKTIE